MPVVDSVLSAATTQFPTTSVAWWAAGAALLVLIMAGTFFEHVLLRRMAHDPRPIHVVQRSRRSARWLVAVATVVGAQVGVITVSLADVDWAGTARPATLVSASAIAALGAAALGYVLTRPAAPPPARSRSGSSSRDVRTAAPTRAGQLLPALVGAAAQEVLFRGAVLGWLLASGMAAVPAVALTALAFGATRLTRGRGATVTATLAGLVLGLAVVITGWVGVAVAGHVTLLLVVAALGIRGSRVSASAGAGSTGVGCGGHDPNSPACIGCPLAPAAARRGAPATATP